MRTLTDIAAEKAEHYADEAARHRARLDEPLTDPERITATHRASEAEMLRRMWADIHAVCLEMAEAGPPPGDDRPPLERWLDAWGTK